MSSSSSIGCSWIAGIKRLATTSLLLLAILSPERCCPEEAALWEWAFEGGTCAELWQCCCWGWLRKVLLTADCSFAVDFSSRFFSCERVEALERRASEEHEALLAECRPEMISPMASGKVCAAGWAALAPLRMLAAALPLWRLLVDEASDIFQW